MACSYISSEDTKSFVTDLNELIEEEKNFNLISPLKNLSHFNKICKDDRVILLERGGCIVKTKIGPI